ncbi:MAG TPA: PASTA domain-containing protein [Candidatus Acidoferrales bacterium]
MVLRERLQWIFRMAVLLFILSSVAFLSALTAMRFAVQGREVAMPDVVGKGVIPAQQILHGRGVGIKIEDRVFSNLPADTVVRQSPPPNMRVKTGQSAHVVLSLGPQKVTIPQLQDRSLRAAQVELLRGGMQLGEVSSVYLPGDGADTVTAQDPAPGNTEVTGPHVNLLVSLGPRPAAYVMPELTGLPITEAQAKLGSAGLRLSKLTPQATSEASSGTIVGQTPARGERVDSSSTIELQVAE